MAQLWWHKRAAQITLLWWCDEDGCCIRVCVCACVKDYAWRQIFFPPSLHPLPQLHSVSPLPSAGMLGACILSSHPQPGFVFPLRSLPLSGLRCSSAHGRDLRWHHSCSLWMSPPLCQNKIGYPGFPLFLSFLLFNFFSWHQECWNCSWSYLFESL